jgi:hypothetical protein
MPSNLRTGLWHCFANNARPLTSTPHALKPLALKTTSEPPITTDFLAKHFKSIPELAGLQGSSSMLYGSWQRRLH